MAKSDMDGILSALLSNPKGTKILGDLDKYRKLLDTPEGKALLSQISGGGGDALKKAAHEASQGDSDAAKKLIGSLLSSPEGAKLAGTIMAMAKDQKK